MSKHKRRHREARNRFKKELHELATINPAVTIMIIETYVASQSRAHIAKIWELLGRHHREAYNDYCDKLMGKSLTGRSEILRNLYFIDKDRFNKYLRLIPEVYAMGDALAVAYNILRKKN